MLQNTGGARLKAVQGRAKTVSPGVWNLTEPIFTEELRKGLPGHRAGRGIRPSVTEGLGPPHPRHGCGLAPGSLALREN